ncbi:hypothetical protein P167DRAFT_134061 [Morchella conica CCBAS932]|uniref:Uncharacterized protein n=1 Tax=Morchella conica CCBAS932 TaxID=1392247 RepID=A0A3N4KXX2_9PEZI|nr:hypothetical protein P167DRAFT_134061 [Morchella conica CCBAS932]
MFGICFSQMLNLSPLSVDRWYNSLEWLGQSLAVILRTIYKYQARQGLAFLLLILMQKIYYNYTYIISFLELKTLSVSDYKADANRVAVTLRRW